MTATLAQLRADAEKAQTALTAEQERQAAAERVAAEARRLRSVDWAFAYVVGYNLRQVEASAKVTDTLAALTEAVTTDLALAARLYLDVTRQMALSNSLGDDLVKARAILKAAGELPGVYRTGRDPVGDSAPWPLDHGLVRFPSFIELVNDTLTARRAIVGRVQSTETPETFEGKASEGLKAEALRREWVLAPEFESLLALKVQMPARFAQLPPEEQASVNAYARTRELVGYDAPLPKMVTEGRGQVKPPIYAPNDAVRVRLYSDGYAPRKGA
jgi:hypothetical protein